VNDIDALRDTAGKLPTGIAGFLPEAIRGLADTLRADLLTCDDPERLRSYIDSALDGECLSILAEISAMAPLNDIAHRVFVSLACSVFKEAGLDVPQKAQEEFALLGATEKAWLEDFRKDIRETQTRSRDPGSEDRKSNGSRRLDYMGSFLRVVTSEVLNNV